MPVLHTVKKKTALAASPILSPPNNAEYEDYKQRLSSIKRSMQATIASINDNTRRFNKLYISIRSFSERYVENYPVEKEATKGVARECEEESQELWDHFVKETGDWVPYKRIHKQIQVYIDEIRGVESKYFELKSRKVEMERYQGKLDKIALASKEPEKDGIMGKVDGVLKKTKGDIDAKKTRNMVKLKRAKARYLDQLGEVIAEQKGTYSKHEIVFRAALAAYWLAHDSHVSCLLKSLHKTIEFAEANEGDMLELDVPNMDVEHLIPKSNRANPTNVDDDDVFQDAHSSHSSFVEAKRQDDKILSKARSAQSSRDPSGNSSKRESLGERKKPVAA